MPQNVTPERPGAEQEAASLTVVRGMPPVSAKAASLKNVMLEAMTKASNAALDTEKVQEQEQKGTTTEEGAKDVSPQKSLPKII